MNIKFKNKANKIHRNKYTYVEAYKGTHIPIKIKCPIHGIFNQTPASHLNGQGCPECGILKNLKNKQIKNKIKFIKEANKKFNNKYSYIKVNYKHKREKVKIKCPIHGIFEQTPYAHLNNKIQCKKCYKEEKIKKEKLNLLISYSTEKYQIEYTIKDVNKLIMTCPKHGDFILNDLDLFSHKKITKFRCNKCIIEENKKIFNNFVKVSNKFHSNKFIYKEINQEIFNLVDKVKIRCPEHGDFYVLPYKHMKGSSCKKCINKDQCFNKIKFYKNNKKGNEIGILYQLKFTSKEGNVFYKIGVTSRSIKERYKSGYDDYSYEIVDEIKMTNLKTVQKESILKKVNKHFRDYSVSKDFIGYSECFSKKLDILDIF